MTETPEAVAPPVIDPDRWDEHEGFRETFLAQFTFPEHNAALRGLGAMLCAFIHEVEELYYRPPEGDLTHCLRAVVADLRYLTGHLENLGDTGSGSDEELALCRLAWRKAASLKKVADALEEGFPVVKSEKSNKKTKKKKKKERR